MKVDGEKRRRRWSTEARRKWYGYWRAIRFAKLGEKKAA